jgi:hypothetical protein
MRQLGNRTKSTDGDGRGSSPHVSQNCERLAQSHEFFPRALRMTEIMTADEAGWRNLRRSASIVSENSRNAASP